MKKPRKPPKTVDVSSLSEAAKKVLEQGGDGKKVAKSFGKARKRILKDLQDPSSDMIAIQLASLRALLRTALGLMVISEESAHRWRNERSLYGSVAIATMIRDLLSDIGRLSDRSLLAGRTMDEVIDPILQSLAMQFSNAVKQLMQDSDLRLDKTEAKWLKIRLKDLLDSYLPLVRESRDDAKSRIGKLLEPRK